MFHEKDVIWISREITQNNQKALVTNYSRVFNGTDNYYTKVIDLSVSSILYLKCFAKYKNKQSVKKYFIEEYNINEKEDIIKLDKQINLFLNLALEHELCYIFNEKETYEFKKIKEIDFKNNTITIELTNICNLKCVYCYCSCLTNGMYINFDKLKEFLYKAKEFGIYWISFTGGECTLHPNFEEIINLASELFLSVQILTNAYQLPTFLLEQRKKYHNLRIQISLDSIDPKSHDMNRGITGAFDKAYANINKLTHYGYPIAISTVIMYQQQNEMEKIVINFLNNNALYIVFGYAEPLGRWTNFDYDDFKIYMEKKKELIHKYPTKVKGSTQQEDEQTQVKYSTNICPSFKNMLVIKPDGNLKPCPIFQETYELGNIFTEKNIENLIANYVISINKIHDEYIAKIDNQCQKCDLKNLCSHCFVKKLNCNMLRK